MYGNPGIMNNKQYLTNQFLVFQPHLYYLCNMID